MTVLHIDTRYVHLPNSKGFDAGVTCETLGYLSISTRSECVDAVKSVEMSRSYDGPTFTAGELPCDHTKPNHCFANGEFSFEFSFTKANCPVHQSKLEKEYSLNCINTGMIKKK